MNVHCSIVVLLLAGCLVENVTEVYAAINISELSVWVGGN